MTYDVRKDINDYYPGIRPGTPAPEEDPSVLETHLNERNNPHEVTAEQVDTYTKSVIDGKISTATTLNKQALDEAVHQASVSATNAQMDAERVDSAILGVQSTANKADKAAKIAQTMRDDAVAASNEAKAVAETVAGEVEKAQSAATQAEDAAKRASGVEDLLNQHLADEITNRKNEDAALKAELEDSKADALTQSATVNNVGDLDPTSDVSMATADQMNDLSYQKATLGAMGFGGTAVKISSFTTFRRGGSTDNGGTNMWLRILRHDGTQWYVAYQATTYVTHGSYNLNGMRINHVMAHKAGTHFIPTDEQILFCYATSEDAPVDSFIRFGMKVVPASPNMLASGQSSLPNVNATPGWAHGLAFDAVYEEKQRLSEVLEGKQDALTAGKNITIENGVISVTGGASDDEDPWVSPGDWMLTVRSAQDYSTVSTAQEEHTTSAGKVIGTTTVTAFTSSTKEVAVEMLDLASPTEPQPVEFRCDGVTLTPGPQGTSCSARADVEGLYRIFATDNQGRTRDAYLNLRAKTRTESVTNTYLADAEGSARKAANDVMLAALAARNRQVTVAVGQTSAVASADQAFNGTTPLTTAPLAPAYFCMVEPTTSWGPDAVAVAPHFAITAAHWHPSATKSATFVTPSGASTTVSGTYGIALTDWARAKGYSESEIDEADIGDLFVWHFTTGTIPDDCIASVMDRSVWERDYDRDLSGILSYTITQNGYLSFAPLLAADGSRYAFGTFNATTTRADMLEHLAPACCATIYGGDSGRPILMVHDGTPVLLSTFWTAGSGPSLIRACEILDAFIRERSAGTEALRRVE